MFPVGRWGVLVAIASPFWTGKPALDSENGRAQGPDVNPDKEQFSGNRDNVKGNSFYFED
jgi:hypothetical protein